MIIKCANCGSDPIGRWRLPPMIVFINRYQADGGLRDRPVYACRDCLSPRREAEIRVREQDHRLLGELR
jgi:hypothetical protein